MLSIVISGSRRPRVSPMTACARRSRLTQNVSPLAEQFSCASHATAADTVSFLMPVASGSLNIRLRPIGTIVLARMPWGAPSSASVWVSPMMPIFAAA